MFLLLCDGSLMRFVSLGPRCRPHPAGWPTRAHPCGCTCQASGRAPQKREGPCRAVQGHGASVGYIPQPVSGSGKYEFVNSTHARRIILFVVYYDLVDFDAKGSLNEPTAIGVLPCQLRCELRTHLLTGCDLRAAQIIRGTFVRFSWSFKTRSNCYKDKQMIME